MDLEGRVDGRSKGGETIIMLYYVRKYFLIKGKTLTIYVIFCFNASS